MRRFRIFVKLVGVLLAAVFVTRAEGGTIAYVVPAGTNGTQGNFGGSLGMDFDVTYGITITQLGVFDSGSDGLGLPLNAHVYDRTSTAVPVATLNFTAGDPGTLVDGSRLKPLATPLMLPSGFQGTIVAEGFGATEPNGNSNGGVPAWSTDDGGGLISFVGGGRFGSFGSYPGTADGGPANRYAAGTFEFDLSPITSGPILLDQGTAAATLSQSGFPIGAAVDGDATPNVSGTGWATSSQPGTGVFETRADVVSDVGTVLTFTLTSGGFGTHTLGRFRISATRDDRSEFADGLDNGGDVTANWSVLDFDSFTSDNPNTTFTELGDGSLLAGGPSNSVETYTLSAMTRLTTITGFRIEMIEDPSLPSNGPGRASNGNFVLLEFEVSHSPLAIPEPSGILLAVIGLPFLFGRRFRRRQPSVS